MGAQSDLAAMGRPDLITAPGWATDAERVTRMDEVIALIEAWLHSFADVESAIAACDAHDVPCAPVLSIEQTVSHPHFIARGTIRTIVDPVAGEFQIPGMPIKTSDFPANNDYVAPLLGEHNDEVLSELLGKSTADIDALRAAGTLFSKPF